MNNRILITGGAGFIGSNLAEYFLGQNWNVTVLDDLSTGYIKNVEPFLSNPNFKFIKGDIRDFDLVSKIIRDNKIQYISHQAARGSVPKSVENPMLSNDININGTLTVLWAAHKLGVKKVVCAISSSVYGDTPELPKKESMPHNPMSPYAITKVACEHYARVFNDLYKLPTVGLRYFNVYGKKQDPNGAYAAVIPKFILNALENKPLKINGDGSQTRDFTYIQDVIKANSLALEHDSANGRSFNIAYGDRIDILSLANLIIKLSGSESEIEFQNPRPGDVHDSLADLQFAERYLKYKPQYPLEKGLLETVEWFKSHCHSDQA